jgi:hypothetical protein
MALTQVRGGQVQDGSIQRVDLDVSTVGQAVIRKLITGTGLSQSYDGADSGTGDVTVSAPNAPNWDAAYSQRLQWDGGGTNLTAATGRTSLGATALGSNLFTLGNNALGVSAFLTISSLNAVTLRSAANFRADIGAEAALGNPSADGYILSSTAAGVRSWIAPPSGSGTITLTGDVTGSGTTSIVTSIAANAVGASEIVANSIGASEINNTQDLGLAVLQTIKVPVSATADQQTVFGVYRNSSGTAAAGFGSRIELGASSDTVANRGQCMVASKWSVAADATRAATMELYCQSGNGLYGTAVMTLFSSKGVCINRTTDPGAGYLDVSAGFKIGGTDIFPLTTARAGVPSGGTAGQYLKKNSSTNYDYSWDQHATTQGTIVASTAGTTSTSGVMGGIPGSITPSTTGRVLFIISGYFSSTASLAFAAIISMRYGTGTAPSHGAAPTGTAIPNCPNAYAHAPTANGLTPFSLAVTITGLTVGTTYWLDVVYGSSSTGSTAKLNTVSLCAIEF